MTITLALGSAVVHKHADCSVHMKDFYSSMHQNCKHDYKLRFNTEMKEDEY